MVVTISNEYGSGGVAVAHAVAQALGYTLVDEQLPVVVAKRLAVAPDDVEATEDVRGGVFERFLATLETSTPELAPGALTPSFDRECVLELQDAVRDAAADGNCVIVGRGASAILHPMPGLLRVFLHAERTSRIARVMDALHLDVKGATREVERIDKARHGYMQRWYNQRWGAPEHYDVSINTSLFGVQGSAEIIVCAVLR